MEKIRDPSFQHPAGNTNGDITLATALRLVGQDARNQLNLKDIQLQHGDTTQRFSITNLQPFQQPAVDLANLRWQDWANFLYALRNVFAHGDAARTLVNGCLPVHVRQHIRNVVSSMFSRPVNSRQRQWAGDILLMLNTMESRLKEEDRSIGSAGPMALPVLPPEDQSLSYMVILWMPRMLKALSLLLTLQVNNDYKSSGVYVL